MYSPTNTPIFGFAPLAYLTVSVLPGAGSRSTVTLRADGVSVLSMIVSDDQLQDLSTFALEGGILEPMDAPNVHELDEMYAEALQDDMERDQLSAIWEDWQKDLHEDRPRFYDDGFDTFEERVEMYGPEDDGEGFFARIFGVGR